jgi:hypothetical protein
MDIVPLCLYITKDKKKSFLDYPYKVRSENKTIITCIDREGYDSYKFFVINPDFRPIPLGANLISFKNGNSKTVSLEIVYDPFNLTEKTNRFIAWLEPTRYCIPIFVFKCNSEMFFYFSLDNTCPNGYNVNTDMKVIYMLPSDNYLFENYNEKCIPSKNNGMSLKKCLLDLKMYYDTSILNYLDKENSDSINSINLLLILLLVIISIIILYNIK